MVDFKPDSELGNQLKPEIAKRLSNVDDPEYVAEFLLVLLSNNRSPAEIVNEFTSLFGSVIDETFVQNVINEIQNYQTTGHFSFQQPPQQQQQQQQQPQQQIAQPTQQQQQPQQLPRGPASQQNLPQIPTQPTQQAQYGNVQSAFAQASPFAPTQAVENNMMVDGSDNKEVRFSDNGAQSAFGNEAFNFSSNNNNNNRDQNDRLTFTKNNRGSMNFKGASVRGGKTITGTRALTNRKQNLTKMMEMSLDNNMDGTTNFVSDQPRERCKEFPHCPNRMCSSIHPTKLCLKFPNCPAINQTCTYLHPGEDDELMKEFERIRETRRAQKQQGSFATNTGITICKFGAICSRDVCPFGHPTPANKDAKVTIMQWCALNKDCKDSSCARAHSSPNYQAPAPVNTFQKPFQQPTSAPHDDANGSVEKVLEQCKFGAYCKNYNCPKRHARSPVICRQGADCTRIDCLFTHPFNEVCRFGVNCTNFKCAYQHPDGKQVATNNANPTGNKVWINGQNEDTGNTAQRQFAVSEDMVMESTPQQQA